MFTAKLFFWRWAFQQKRHTYLPWYSKHLDKEMCMICGRGRWRYRHLKVMTMKTKNQGPIAALHPTVGVFRYRCPYRNCNKSWWRTANGGTMYLLHVATWHGSR